MSSRHDMSYFLFYCRTISYKLPPSAMEAKWKRSAEVAAASKRMMVNAIQLEQPSSSSAESDICTYWSANPAFHSKKFLLRRLFFINEDKTKYVSLGFYNARDFHPLEEFGAIRRGGSKSLILADEHFDTLAGCLSGIRDSICSDDSVIINCESGIFRL